MTLEQTEVFGLFKDTDSGAVLSQNEEALASYKARKSQLRKFSTMEKRIESIEKDLNEVKRMLSRLINIK